MNEAQAMLEARVMNLLHGRPLGRTFEQLKQHVKPPPLDSELHGTLKVLGEKGCVKRVGEYWVMVKEGWDAPAPTSAHEE
jgi:hypothetical protein